MSSVQRKISFGAGPARWPEEVLDRIRDSIGPDDETGLSILEESHRGPRYTAVHDETVARLRRLLEIPDSHEVVFVPGGATMQFALVPLNLRRPGESADYVITGSWSRKALDHATATGRARVAATGEASDFTAVPPLASWELDAGAAFLHVTTNNTIRGTSVRELPAASDVPLVVDASSDVLTRELPFSEVALLYAGAQKCLGPAGLGVVVVRRDLLDRAPEGVPSMLRYRDHAKAGSRLNTPPTALVWLTDRMLEWVEDQGGLPVMIERAEERARLVYAALDASPDVYETVAAREDRSRTNITFRLRAGREEDLLARATELGMTGIKGHRSVGGFRISMYVGMPVEAAARMGELLREFPAEI